MWKCQNAFSNAQRNKQLQKLIVNESNKVPSNMSYHLRYFKMAMECCFLWQSKSSIIISKQVWFSIKLIYNYLLSSARWESPIGHLIPRDPFIESQGDASYMCIGVTIPAIKVFVLLPFSREIQQHTINEDLWINALEFAALFPTYITFLVDYNLHPNEFPPFPVLWLDSGLTANLQINGWEQSVLVLSLLKTYYVCLQTILSILLLKGIQVGLLEKWIKKLTTYLVCKNYSHQKNLKSMMVLI